MNLSFASKILLFGSIMLSYAVHRWQLDGILSPPSLTEKQDKTVYLLITGKMKERVELAFDKHLHMELEKLEKITRVSSFEEMLTMFEHDYVPKGTKLQFSGVVTKYQLQEMGKMDFEIELFRIRNTQNWIAIKGDANGVQSREVGPLYLFDLSIHNHPHSSGAPSAFDIRTDFEDNIGGATQKIIIEKNGITFFNTLNLKNFGQAPYYIHPNTVIFLHEGMLREIRNNGIEPSYSLHEPKVLKIWKDYYSFRGIQFQFIAWDQLDNNVNPSPSVLQLSKEIESPYVNVRLNVLKLIDNSLVQIDERLAEIFKHYVHDPDEQLQLGIVHLLEYRGLRWVAIRETFVGSKFSSVREIALSSLPIPIRTKYQNRRHELEISL